MNPQDHIVFVVDDDRRICEALSELLSSFDLHVVTFGSAAEYIAYPKPDVPACLILDVELPDMNGLKLQSETAERDLPEIIFITGHGDIPMSVRAMKAGAVDFLTKPVREADLLRAVSGANMPQRWLRGYPSRPPMSHAEPIVFVVDDDVSVRESLELLLGSAGWQPETFASAHDFLARPRSLTPSCLVLDVSLPDL